MREQALPFEKRSKNFYPFGFEAAINSPGLAERL
jgi:hypothetical protein